MCLLDRIAWKINTFTHIDRRHTQNSPKSSSVHADRRYWRDSLAATLAAGLVTRGLSISHSFWFPIYQLASAAAAGRRHSDKDPGPPLHWNLACGDPLKTIPVAAAHATTMTVVSVQCVMPSAEQRQFFEASSGSVSLSLSNRDFPLFFSGAGRRICPSRSRFARETPSALTAAP